MQAGQQTCPGAVLRLLGVARLAQGTAQEALPIAGRDQHDAAPAVAVQQSDLELHGRGQAGPAVFLECFFEGARAERTPGMEVE